MTDCCDSTMLRTHLDHPDPEVEHHLDECDTCTGLLRSVASDAGYVRSRLALLDAADDALFDVEAALAAVRAHRTAAETAPGPPTIVGPMPVGARRARARRRWLAAAVAVAAATTVTPAGQTALATALDVFRSERFQILPVDLGEWATRPVAETMRSLEAIGDVDLTGLNGPVDVDLVPDAEAVAGIDAPVLPDEPDELVAMAPGTVRVVLERRSGNGVPDELDGVTLIVDVPGAIAAAFRTGVGTNEYVIGRTDTVAIRTEGAPLEDVRAFLLARDDLPEQLRDQLAGIDDWRTTIPVPVPIDGPSWRDVELAGRPGVAFGDDSGIGALVLRDDPDGITVVGGRITVTDAIALAEDA